MHPAPSSPDGAPRHLYAHVPFCRSKCAYCAFHSTVEEPAPAFAAQLVRELRLRSPEPLPLRTLYVGGGTPTALGEEGLVQLCGRLRDALRRNPASSEMPLEEWTVEANPGTFSTALARRLRDVGVSRLSVGAQSFDPSTLALLGRTHDVAAIGAAIGAGRAAGIPHLGIDLIAGVPGTSPEAWRRTLEAAVELETDHLSVYALTIEPGTPLAQSVEAGHVETPDESAQMDALALAEELLARHGFSRYEISNYARPGGECRHNLAVWRGEDYLGIGPAAASRWGRCRWTNAPDTAAWSAALDRGARPPAEVETLSEDEDAAERFLTGLRLAEGVRPDPATTQGRQWADRLAALSRVGVVERHAGDRWRLTRRGREVADAVVRDLSL